MCAFTHHPQADGGTAYGSRALSEGDPAGHPFLAQYNRSADATGGLCIGRSSVNALGLGVSATNRLHRAYTGALLATTVSTFKYRLNAVQIDVIL